MSVKDNIQKKTVNCIKRIAEHSLRVDANNLTSLWVYQPEVPAILKKFSRINKG